MKTILVVDDEPALRFAVKVLLEAEQYAIIESDNGRDGIAAALRQLPDLILCDIEMPQLNGFEMLKELRRHDQTSTIPFIFLTGNSYTTHWRDGMNYGADDFLTKPFSAEALLRAIDTRLNRLNAYEEKARKQIDEFRSNITLTLPHELRTPLNTLLGMTDALRNRGGDLRAGEASEIAEGLHEAAERLHHTLENFWAYARTELISLDREWTKPSAPIRIDQVLEIESRGVAQKYDRADDLHLNLVPMSMHVQLEHFERIIEELIDNAFRFSLKRTAVHIETAAGNGIVSVWIKDNGRGMTAEEISRIGAFMQFERRLYEQQGLGLGFAIAKKLTELHGGHLTVHSDPAQGTTVTISIPGAPINAE